MRQRQTGKWAVLALLLAAPLAQAGPIELKVMTRNVYFGAELAPILAAPPPAIPFAVAGVVANVAASKPEERMQRVAQEIFAAQPHIVGLQEVVLWRSQTPSDFVPSPPNAAAPMFGGHFSQQIVDALAGLGLSYKIYARKQNADAEAPGFNLLSPNSLTDYRLTDHDAILVRDDLPASELKVIGEGTKTFAVNLTGLIGGSPLQLPRSYGFVDVEMQGIPFRVFNTHLEGIVGAINELQALELIGATDASPYSRVIALGDFNTISDTGPTLTDEFMLGAGFSDAWADKGVGPGFTFGFDADLADGLLTERLDYVFHRGGFQTLDVDVIGTTPFDVGGDGPPLWPSDHAGVVAVLLVVPEPGTIVLVWIALGALTATRYRFRYSRRRMSNS